MIRNAIHGDATAPASSVTDIMAVPQDIALADWEDMLNAVKARLRMAVGAPLTQQFNGAAGPLRASVLECVDALDQLHATLAHAIAQHDQIDVGGQFNGRGGDKGAPS